MEFNYYLLALILIATYVCYRLTIKGESSNIRFHLVLMFLFIFIYSGVGGALVSANQEYTFYYVVYLFIFSITFASSKKMYFKYSEVNSLRFNAFIEKYANKFIIIHLLLLFFQLIYPEIKLHNLISPPQPDLSGYDFTEEGSLEGLDAISKLRYYISNMVVPFFYWSLYKYNKRPWIIALILLVSLYLTFCSSGYVSRSAMLFNLILIFMSVYRLLSRENRKRLLIGVSISSPIILFAFYQYSVMRLSATTENVSIGQAVELLFSQEIGYPLHFDGYINLTKRYAYDFIEWLVLLPLPGFMKFGQGNFALNREFSIGVLGLDPSDQYFFILLPGVIGESIFVFGKTAFICHAILLAVITRYVLSTLDKCESLIFVFYYYMVQLSFGMARAGTISIYPSIFKYFVILLIVLSYLKKKSIKTQVPN